MYFAECDLLATLGKGGASQVNTAHPLLLSVCVLWLARAVRSITDAFTSTKATPPPFAKNVCVMAGTLHTEHQAQYS